MGLRRLSAEATARWAVGLTVIGVPLALAGAWRLAESGAITLRARLSEAGGWQPVDLRATVGEPLDLRMISDDVVHGFAIGRVEMTPIDLPPGEVVPVSLVFQQPGTYTYYCTRWCGPEHWRMRGVIEVSGEGVPVAAPPEALYVSLGIDLDAEHDAAFIPAVPPSATRGAVLGVDLPDGFRTRYDFVTRPPAEIWQALRDSPATEGLSDGDVWDLVAHLWKSTTTSDALRQGASLYATNCAACHGEGGAGDGVMVDSLPEPAPSPQLHGLHDDGPSDFTAARHMLGASSALLHGKLVRGGMGTGMPYWGPILTDAQAWAVVDYLWTFQFKEEE